MNQILRTWIVMFLVAFLSGSASAQDVYNFYFQKSGKKTEEEKKEEPVEEQLVEGVMEVDSDVLLVPDNWQPAQKRYKKVYVRKSPKNTIAEKMLEPEKPKDPHRGWAAKLGIGAISIGNYGGMFGGEVTQQTYVLGATYHMSKYFQVNSENSFT